MAGLGCQKRGVKIARVMKAEGGEAAEDMSAIHEAMEPEMEEARETKLEKKGYEETKTGKMIKAAKEGIKKVSETAKKNVKFVTPAPIKETSEPSDEMDEYFTKETRVGKNQFKVERVKKSDDEIGYRRSRKAKGGLIKIAKDLKKSSSMHLKQSKTLDKLLKKDKK